MASVDDRNPVEQLAEEFAQRTRDGERPSVTEYVQRHPDLESEIRELFPTIAALERLRRRQGAAPGEDTAGLAKLERLGEFRIIREIGRGGMGVVYEAEQESLGRHVAVKVLPKQSLLDEKHLRRFRREARTAARLHHTNIVPILAVGEHDGYHFYVMQYIDGVGLDELIGRLASDRPSDFSTQRLSDYWRLDQHIKETVAAERTDTNSVLLIGPAARMAANAAGARAGRALRGGTYWQDTARIGMQAASALDYAHQHGTLHRDVKPSNLIIDGEGIVWVADFGLAKAAEQDAVSHTGDIVGTLRFMAPEQLTGQADPRSDIYALGATLYELLTLRPVHDEASRKRSLVGGGAPPRPLPPRRHNRDVPRDLETIVLKALAERPQDRYATAGQMANDLQRFIEDRPITARRASAPERLWRWARRNRAVASLSGLAAALLLLVAVVSTVSYYRTEQARSQEFDQRVRAEAALGVSIDALDRVYQRFAPERVLEAPAVSLSEGAVSLSEGEEQEGQIELPAQPVLSRETAAMLEDMLTFYDRLAELDSDDEKLRHAAALATRRLGDIYQRLGQTDEAMDAYTKAVERFEQLKRQLQASGRQAQALAVSTEMARIHNEQGNVLSRTANRIGPRLFHGRALHVLESLAQSSSQPEVRYELARTHYFIGRRRGLPPPPDPSWGPQFGGRRGLLRRGFGRGSQAPDRDREPDSADRSAEPTGADRSSPSGRSSPGRTRRNRVGPWPSGGARGGTSRPSWVENNEHLQQAIDLLAELQQEHPKVPEYPRLMALCYRDRWRGYFADPEGIDHALALLEQLVAEHPESADFRFDLCETYTRLSTRRLSPEQQRDVERRLETALVHARQLDTLVPAYLSTRSQICFKLGALLGSREQDTDEAAEDRLKRAEEHFRDALKWQSELVSQSPDTHSHRMWRAGIGETLAELLSRREDEDSLKDVVLLLLQAADDQTLLAQASSLPMRPYFYGALARIHTAQAGALRQQGLSTEAGEARKKAAEAREQAAEASKEAAESRRRQLWRPGRTRNRGPN